MDQRLKSSFRDPSGYIFSRDGEIFRAVSTKYMKIKESVLNFV